MWPVTVVLWSVLLPAGLFSTCSTCKVELLLRPSIACKHVASCENRRCSCPRLQCCQCCLAVVGEPTIIEAALDLCVHLTCAQQWVEHRVLCSPQQSQCRCVYTTFVGLHSVRHCAAQCVSGICVASFCRVT
jgi:hypothetical protein